MHVYTSTREQKKPTRPQLEVGRFLRDRSPKRKSLSSVSTYVQKVAPYKRWRDGGERRRRVGGVYAHTHTHTQECRREIAKKNTGEKDNPTGDQRSALEKKKNQETKKKKKKGGETTRPFLPWEGLLARETRSHGITSSNCIHVVVFSSSFSFLLPSRGPKILSQTLFLWTNSNPNCSPP
jgi:hypothetical protein